MQQLTCLRSRILCAAVAALGLGSLAVSHAQAVNTYNFDVNGSTSGFGVTTGTTYDWDDTTNGGFWSDNVTSPGTNGISATHGWVQGNFPKFQPGGAPTYTVTVSNIEQITGLFASTGQNLTIDAIGSGGLEVVAGVDGFLGTGSATTTINAPISGPGTVNPSNGGNLFLNGVNTYTGGTSLVSSGTLVHFNNDSAFGTGTITNNLSSTTGFVPLLAAGGTTVTLANDFVNAVNNSGINFAADAGTPVVSSGDWSLGTKNLRLRNNGDASSPLTLSGDISGSAGITLSSSSSASIIFSGANSGYTGTTTITGPGGTGAGTSAVSLVLGASNTLASSSSVALAGGILDPDGFSHNMGSTTLALLSSTGASTIDFGAGASELDFANSSAVSWTGSMLNLLNWDPSMDKIRFGTDSTGLTADQLAMIEFNGAGLGTAILDANGYVSVPEPASLSLLGLGSTALLARRKRRA